MKSSLPPTTVEELLRRAQGLAGMSLAEIAQELDITSPDTLRQGKGWTGQLCERLLGADAGSEAQPDFKALQIELKTLPIDPEGKPLESTFVCSIPLQDIRNETWLTSRVYRKLQTVLWLPIICPQKSSLLDRHIGMPLLWQPTSEQLQLLQKDWHELTDMICLGQLEEITAYHGEILQIRPKGANAKSTVWGSDAAGNKIRTLGRGFYLRSRFTQSLLQQHFHV